MESIIIPLRDLTITDPKQQHPENFNVKLREHQLACMDKMKSLEHLNIITRTSNIYTNKGILAEGSGSGKSLIALGLIKNTQNIECKKTKIVQGSFGFHSEVPRKVFVNTSLIVCHEHLKTHWEQQLNMTGLTYHIIQFPREFKPIHEYSYYDVVVVCSNRLRDFRNSGEYIFKRVIVDDAEFMSRACAKKIPEGFFCWYIVSYLNIFRQVYNYYNEFKNVRVRELNSIIVRTDYYRKPLLIYNELTHVYESDTKDTKKIVHFLREGDFIGAVKTLGGVLKNYSGLQQALEMEYMSKIDEIKDNANSNELMDRIYLRHRNILDNLDSSLQENCSICLCPIQDPTMALCCNNFYCAECIANTMIYSNTKCPSCRYVSPGLIMLSDEEQPDVKQAPSLEEIIEAIFQPNSKIIIMIRDYELFNMVRRVVLRTDIPCFSFFNPKDKDINHFTRMASGLGSFVLFLNDDPPCGLKFDNITDVVVEDQSDTTYLKDSMCYIGKKSLYLNIHTLKPI